MHGTIASDIASLYKWLILIEIEMKRVSGKKSREKACIQFSVVVNYITSGQSKVALAAKTRGQTLTRKYRSFKENET